MAITSEADTILILVQTRLLEYGMYYYSVIHSKISLAILLYHGTDKNNTVCSNIVQLPQ